MTRDFNIRDYDWDPNYLHHSTHTKDLNLVANSPELELFPSSNPGSTRYANNSRNTNLVLNLVFLLPHNSGFGKYIFFLDKRKPSNYISIAIEVGMKNKDIDVIIQSIKKDSEEEDNFIKEIKENIKQLDTKNINDKPKLKTLVNKLAMVFGSIWSRHTKIKRITKHSKKWWNQKCTASLTGKLSKQQYRWSKENSLMTKYRKLQFQISIYRTSQIRSKRKYFQLLRQLYSKTSHIILLTLCRMPSIDYTILLKIN